MDTRQLKYFLNLAQTLNFTQAAALSNITQPTLTKATQRLEEEYGGLFVYRDGKDSRLTELGRTLRDEFQTIISREERARDLANMIVKGRRSVVNIGISSTLGPANFLRVCFKSPCSARYDVT
jgi:LysR family hydrogen peroxide-inducible transcriptional activator